MIQLREWQSAALIKALDWFSNTEGDNHFLINAAPGAGKTLASCAIAQELILIYSICSNALLVVWSMIL